MSRVPAPACMNGEQSVGTWKLLGSKSTDVSGLAEDLGVVWKGPHGQETHSVPLEGTHKACSRSHRSDRAKRRHAMLLSPLQDAGDSSESGWAR